MKKMMADMMIEPSGDVDRDFAEMMMPRRQRAIDMTQAGRSTMQFTEQPAVPTAGSVADGGMRTSQ